MHKSCQRKLLSGVFSEGFSHAMKTNNVDAELIMHPRLRVAKDNPEI
jgi:hypothetical protein